MLVLVYRSFSTYCPFLDHQHPALTFWQQTQKFHVFLLEGFKKIEVEDGASQFFVE